ncbi:MAG: DUF4129 domain-containing protein [Candidatus Bipolaricaulota bacterium]|nr:DUF4129 domain-containing protein [Candidatus Bipolaricaulota bacterium]
MSAVQRRRILLGGVFAVLFGVLFVLIGGLNSTTFLPGKPLPNPFTAVDIAPFAGTASQGTWGMNAVRLTVQILLILALVVIVIFAIISSEFRWILLTIALIFVVILAILARVEITQRGQQVEVQEQPDIVLGEPPPPAPPVQVEIPDARATDWLMILTALGSAAVLTGIGLFLLLRVYPALQKRRTERNLLLNELGQRAREAVTSIRAGGDPRAAILRCYKEMSEIVSREERIPNFAYFTPREFAARLRSSGMMVAHVDRLTAIFEQVRYGGRPGETFVDEALGCLEALEEAYSGGGAE